MMYNVLQFLGWLDRGSSISGFLEITTPSGRKVTLTENHIIFVENNKRHQPKYAGDVTLEDTIYTLENEKLQETTIASIKRVSLQGYRTPLTETGTLLGKFLQLKFKLLQRLHKEFSKNAKISNKQHAMLFQK